METRVTSLPMLILAATCCRGVLSVNFWLKILSWMKIATTPCAL